MTSLTLVHYPVRAYAYEDVLYDRQAICGFTGWSNSRAEIVAISPSAWYGGTYHEVEMCGVCALLCLGPK
jgi:hypothetical protein